MTRSTEPSTTSMPSPLSKSSAMMARSRRLVLFRVTALPTALETINPALGSSSVGRIFADTTTFRLPKREPERCVSKNCAAVRIRWCCGSTRSGSCRHRHRHVLLGASTCATLATAGGQDCTTGASTHTGTEAMLTGTAAVIRLKSPLSHCYFSTLSQTQKHTLGSASQTALAQKTSAILVHYLFMLSRCVRKNGTPHPGQDSTSL